MSDAFDERKTAAEAKFKNDEEFKFKVIARRNKLLGMWAAELMNMNSSDAEAYAKQVVVSDFEEPGDDDVLRKVFEDLKQKGHSVTEVEIRAHMEKLLGEATAQLAAE